MSDDAVPVADFRDFFDTAPSEQVSALVNGRLVNGRLKHGAFIPDAKEVHEELDQPIDGVGIEDRRGGGE